MNPSLIADVVRFELARSLSPGRLSIWVLLTAFPILLIGVVRWVIGTEDPERLGIMLYVLVPQVTCILGLLLWGTPAISTELEGQTWIYLAMRRSGRSMVLVGKYLTAVLWTLSSAFVSITACCLLMGSASSIETWAAMCILAVLSCVVHGALYVLIGVIFFRRTMVAAVGYTLAFEVGLGNIPAVINKVLISYRLRGILADWTGWDIRSSGELMYGVDPTSTHLIVLITMAAGLLVASLFWLRFAEYPTQQDGSA